MLLDYLTELLAEQKDYISYCWTAGDYLTKKKNVKGITLYYKISDVNREGGNLITLLKVTKKWNGEVYIYLNRQDEPTKDDGQNVFKIKKYVLFLKIKKYLEDSKNSFIVEEGAEMQVLEQYTPLNVPQSYDKKIFYRTLFLKKNNPVLGDENNLIDYKLKDFLNALKWSIAVVFIVIAMSLVSKMVWGEEVIDDQLIDCFYVFKK